MTKGAEVMTYVPQVHENSKFIKQGEQEQVQSAGGYHLISNQENVERKKIKINKNKIKWKDT